MVLSIRRGPRGQGRGTVLDARRFDTLRAAARIAGVPVEPLRALSLASHGLAAGWRAHGGQAQSSWGSPGIVKGSGSGHSPVAEPAAPAVATAAVQRAGRPLDHWPLLKASYESIIQDLEGKEGHCQEVRDAAQLMQKLEAIVSSAATRKSGEGGSDLRELSTSAAASPPGEQHEAPAAAV